MAAATAGVPHTTRRCGRGAASAASASSADAAAARARTSDGPRNHSSASHMNLREILCHLALC